MLNVDNMSGSTFLNFFLLSVIEGPAYFMGVWLSVSTFLVKGTSKSGNQHVTLFALTQGFSIWGSQPFLGSPKSFIMSFYLWFIEVCSILGSQKYKNILKRVAIQKSLRTPALMDSFPDCTVSWTFFLKQAKGSQNLDKLEKWRASLSGTILI